jgi:Uroporphyrinogen-III synthase
MSESLPPKTCAVFDTEANRRIINKLQNDDCEMILLPEVSAAKSNEFVEEIEPLNYDWLIFPDVYAADFFLEKLIEQGFDLYELDAVRVCAFGEAVSDRLRFAQIHADVIPPKLENETIYESLRDYISGDKEFENLRFLLVKEQSTRLEIAEKLRNLKAEVTEISLYRFQVETDKNLTKLKTLLKGGAADEMIFTSPFDASALNHLFGEPLSELLKGTRVSATDEVTFQTLIEHGLRPLYFRK